MLSRKGQYTLGHKWIYFIVAIFLLTAMFLGLRSLFITHQVGSIQCLDDIVDEVIVGKILYSPSCMTYYDPELNRAFPGTINMDKFTNETLEQCFTYIIKPVKLTIGDKSIGSLDTSSPKIINKPIQTYQDGVIKNEILTFTFREAAC